MKDDHLLTFFQASLLRDVQYTIIQRLTKFTPIIFQGDWFGRRKCILGSVVITAIFIFVESFSNGWPMMLACRFIVGAGIGGKH